MKLTFKEPHIIRATYRIVTPMFIGDAEQKASGISPASVKGALRFWWRALNWGRIRSQIQSDREALQKLHEEEGTLFGTSADNGKAAQFTLQVFYSGNKTSDPKKPTNGIQYLLGQGLYHFGNGYLRPVLQSGSTFEIQLQLQPKRYGKSQEQYLQQKSQLIDALLIFGLLGGLGSRARKGFGSVAIQSMSVDGSGIKIPSNSDEFLKLVQAHRTRVSLPPFTAFSALTRIDMSLQGDGDPLVLLDKVGEQQQLYRSFGRADNTGKHKVAGKPAEQNFKKDHDLVEKIITSKSATSIPQRSIFGLPHNYFFSSTKKKADFAPAMSECTRRTSPLLIHVHQFPDGKTAIVQSLFPAEFLPDNTILEFKMQQGKANIHFNQQMIDWQVIHKYMDRFSERMQTL
ncbi:type III-B CRISPR module RAMP protein Cmr1 [Thiofilum flexile]|uniref:type III-B CRISPR module RAMP protein Cmr1 n=1 Tax=Thiofilum flexile TaxID=125627 RepID=UPI000364A719|nr:type III-B CRISPR module RAMP protein Cmr1 [Thiofilum flexile]